MRRHIGSVTQVGAGVWRVQVTRGHDPLTGRRRRLSRTVRGRKADAERELSRMSIEAGVSTGVSMTLAEYIDTMYLPHVLRSVRPRTATEYESKLRLYVTPSLGHVRLDKLEPYLLDRWMGRLGVGTLSDSTRLYAYRVLHAALRQAMRWQLMPSNPLDCVQPPAVKRTTPDTLTAAEANAYLDAFAGHRLEPIVVLALAAGLRRSELAALTWADVDLAAFTVTVSRGMHQRGKRVWYEAPKSATSARVVSLPPWAVEALRPHRGLGPLVTDGKDAMAPDTISAVYAAHAEAHGLRRVPLKNLRHTHATLALAAGVDLVSVSRRLGHSAVAVTDTFYLAPGRVADEKAAAAIEGIRTRAISGHTSESCHFGATK